MAAYPEKLLHRIWEKLHFEFRNARVEDGRTLNVIDPGTPNTSDGPDFLNASVQIGSLNWFGDVEIHWDVGDWKSHGHHKDPGYNRVILHVVYNRTDSTVLREDKTSVPTLCLESRISKPLGNFLNQYRTSPALPCAGRITFISQEAFRLQLEKSHREYFEQKVNDLIACYDPGLKPSRAWQKALAVSLFDGLGISHNRRPMQKLARKLFPLMPKSGSPDNLRKLALNVSGLAEKPPPPDWNHKGCRPGNHPRFRVQQGAELLWFIGQRPFERWFSEKPRVAWKAVTGTIRTEPGLGRERASILYGTVFLPALYALGNLFFAEELKKEALDEWNRHRARIPESLLEEFRTTPLDPRLYRHKLGAVHQLRSYCKPRHCGRCKVFKSIISP